MAKNGKIFVLNGQKFAKSEFSRHIEYEDQKPSKLSILAKNDEILATNGQILAISEFSRHIHYDFLKEDHKGSFNTKNYESL